jgi:hypothetical protein
MLSALCSRGEDQTQQLSEDKPNNFRPVSPKLYQLSYPDLLNDYFYYYDFFFFVNYFSDAILMLLSVCAVTPSCE